MLHIRMKGKVSFSTHTRWWGKGAGNPRATQVLQNGRTGPSLRERVLAKRAYTGTLSADARLAAHPTRSLGVSMKTVREGLLGHPWVNSGRTHSLLYAMAAKPILCV